MRVTFKNMVHSYSGKCDGLVYYYNRKFHREIVRQLPVFKATQQNNRFGEIAANLKALEISAGYKNDLRMYTELYSSRRENWKNPVSGWYNVFMKLMWAMSKDMGLDLKTLTREQIETEQLPCITVKSAVEAGYLTEVRDYQNLTHQI